MPRFSRAQVRTMLAMHGFSPPDADVTEATHRLNALIEGLTTLEDIEGVFQVEPWTALPYRGVPDRKLNDRPIPEATEAHTDEIAFMTITEQARLIRTKQLSPVELVQRYLDRIKKYDPYLNA